MLFLPERHEPLTARAWDERRAREALDAIVADTNGTFTPEGLWPIHPFDVSPERPPDCLKHLYNGAAGVIWALHDLNARGLAPLAHDFTATARDLARRHADDLERYPQVRAYIGHERGAFLFGETGFHLLEWKLAPSAQLEDKLHASIESRIGDNRGVVWGGAGTMRAALFLHAATKDDHWRALWLRHAEALWAQWHYDENTGCHLWTIDLYGVVEKRLTALHGFLANAGALLQGRHLLTAERAAELGARIAQTIRATAHIEGDHANWPFSPETANNPKTFYVQHCNGAPGIVNTLAPFAGAALDDLLLKAGELAWHAGPTIKMPSVCHGTPGTGYAFLKLHARTGDPLWLDRARRFAMHAIEQGDAAKAKYGQRKFSLWTGDLGLALFLADCLEPRAAFPTLDYF